MNIYLFVFLYSLFILFIVFIPSITIFFIRLYRKKKKINIDKCYLFLKDVDYCMKKHNVFYYLSEGTALGIYRDNNLIKNDDDIDIAIFDKDYNQFCNKVIPDLIKLGYFPVHNINSKMKEIIGRGHVLDVEVVDINRNCVSKYGRPCKELLPYIQKFKTKEWRGIILQIPEKNYYIYLYGNDWHIPQYKKPSRK